MGFHKDFDAMSGADSDDNADYFDHKRRRDQERPSHLHGTAGHIETPQTVVTEAKFQAYLGGLTWWASDTVVLTMLQEAGIKDLVSVRFMENRANGQSKGYCLITVESAQSLTKVFALRDKVLFNHKLVVKPVNKQTAEFFEESCQKRVATGGGGQQSQQPNMNHEQQMTPSPFPPDHPGVGAGFGHPRPPGFPPRHPHPPGLFDIGWGGGGGMGQNRPPQPMFRMPYPGSRGPMMPRPFFPGPPNQRQFFPPECGFPGPRLFDMANWQPRPIGMPPGPSHGHSGMLRPCAETFQQSPQSQMMMPSLAFQHNSQAHVNPAFLERDLVDDEQLEIEDIIHRNKQVSKCALSQALKNIADGQYETAMDNLDAAIAVLRKSSLSTKDERVQIMIKSLNDTKAGIYAECTRQSISVADLLPKRTTRSRSRSLSRSRQRSSDRDRFHKRVRYYEYDLEHAKSRSRSRERERVRDREHDRKNVKSNHHHRQSETDRRKNR